MLSCQILSSARALSSSSSSSSHQCRFSKTTLKIRCSSLRFQEKEKEKKSPNSNSNSNSNSKMNNYIKRDEEGSIRVPRQKYISVSKSELLDAIVLSMFRDDNEDDVHHFLLLSSCLDSILHAEHKTILEEMRTDYSLSPSVEEGEENDLDDMPILPFDYNLALRNILYSSSNNNTNGASSDTDKDSRVAVATRFQRAFIQLLYNAQFEELSARDLRLTSALNTDYLLTLPIYVDWKRLSDSNAIIFRRGYATERQKGLLLGEKLDYIQSKLLQGIFFIMSKPLGKFVSWINEAFKSSYQTLEVQDWTKRLKGWLKEFYVFQQSYLYDEQPSDNLLGVNQLSDRDLPIWLAAQRAVTRYEGMLSSVGPRGRLLRKLLTWIGLIPPTTETPYELESESNLSEPYLRPIFLSRISLSDIWKPASRKYCGNDLWKMLKTSISIILSQSILQEPAFQELILLYTKEVAGRNTEDKAEVPSLQLKIYEKIPIPDLPVIFPHKKLSFRIIDTVRLDIATVLGLLAYFINYKFENILSSPSAIFLDVIAASTLIIYVTRVALGYKQTWDRYQLLVNRTLYEKTLASGFGAVHFLLDASEQQQYKEAILAYAILLKAEKSQVTCRQIVGNKCERFMYEVFKEKIEMPVDKAMDTLVRLGLAIETPIDGIIRLQANPRPEAYEALKERWNDLLNEVE